MLILSSSSVLVYVSTPILKIGVISPPGVVSGWIQIIYGILEVTSHLARLLLGNLCRLAYESLTLWCDVVRDTTQLENHASLDLDWCWSIKASMFPPQTNNLLHKNLATIDLIDSSTSFNTWVTGGIMLHMQCNLLNQCTCIINVQIHKSASRWSIYNRSRGVINPLIESLEKVNPRLPICGELVQKALEPLPSIKMCLSGCHHKRVDLLP